MRFRAHIDDLASMLAWIRSQGASAGLNARTLHQIELASEEGITNIIRHAFREHEEGEIDIVCEQPEKGAFRVRLYDEGMPVNPLEGPPTVAIEASAAERELGGLGVFLIQNLMDEVSYAREDNRNVLTMTKRIRSQSEV